MTLSSRLLQHVEVALTGLVPFQIVAPWEGFIAHLAGVLARLLLWFFGIHDACHCMQTG
jgi:hypothetical protein